MCRNCDLRPAVSHRGLAGGRWLVCWTLRCVFLVGPRSCAALCVLLLLVASGLSSASIERASWSSPTAGSVRSRMWEESIRQSGPWRIVPYSVSVCMHFGNDMLLMRSARALAASIVLARSSTG